MSQPKIEKEINGKVVELVPSTEIVQFVFIESVNENTLKDLRKKYPKKLNLDMSIDADFKAARKIKTEFNKITKDIDARRIAYSAEVKVYGDNLIADLGKIYNPYISAFEAENKRQKDEKARIEKEHQEMLSNQREEVQGIKSFIDTCMGQSALFIAETIQAVDEIDTDVFHKDVIHEAIEVKKYVRAQLDTLYDAAKNQERLEAERAELEEKQAQLAKEQAERQKLIDEENEKAARAAEIETRINNLRNDSSNYRNKSSVEIKARIAQLEQFVPTREVFEDRADEVAKLMSSVIEDHRDRLEMVEFKEAKQTRDTQIATVIVHEEIAQEQANPAPTTSNHSGRKELVDPTDDNSNIFGKSELLESIPDKFNKPWYEPLSVWPSDQARADNHDLHVICCQLEKAELFIDENLSL